MVTKLEGNCCLLKLKRGNSKQIDKLEVTKTANTAKTKKSEPQKQFKIQFEDFAKMDIRTGTILKPKKCRNKTLILKDTGIDVRTIVSGIAESLNLKIL
jgi:methionyl-tRNA synthetase